MKKYMIDTSANDAFISNSTVADLEITTWTVNGSSIMYLRGEVAEQMQLDYHTAAEEVTLCFNLQGKTTLINPDLTDPIEFANNSHNILYIRNAGTQIQFEASTIALFVIRIPVKLFFEICSSENTILKQFNQQVATHSTVSLFSTHLNIDFLLQTCLYSILHCKYENSLKRIFLFSKIVELIVLQVESYNNGTAAGKAYIKTEYDKERIVYAKDYLLKHLECPPSLKQLARVSGINEFKLKKGFKELFGQTVYEYLAVVRLEIAKNELLENTKSIGQIAFELGYSSLQHFSNSFKRKYGVSPGRYKGR